MVLSQLLSLLGLASVATSAPNNAVKRAPTVYLAGDSTMARSGSNIQGWGVYFPYSTTLTVQNNAIGGRSSRSYTVEGRFDEIANSVQSGDIVIIEFGHNDGGGLGSGDNGRAVCPGAGSETCQSTYNGEQVTVLTYPAYLINAGQLLVSRGAQVIISSPTPNNPWEGGTFGYAPSRFTTYARDAAAQIGGNAFFVDHGQYTADIFEELGRDTVNSFYPNDHTHTSPAGANVVAGAFVKALLCAGGGPLSGSMKNTTESVAGSCV